MKIEENGISRTLLEWWKPKVEHLDSEQEFYYDEVSVNYFMENKNPKSVCLSAGKIRQAVSLRQWRLQEAQLHTAAAMGTEAFMWGD